MQKNRMTEKEESVVDKIQDLIDDTDDLNRISFYMDESDINSADDVFEYIEDRCQEWARQDLDDIRDDIEDIVDEWVEESEDDE